MTNTCRFALGLTLTQIVACSTPPEETSIGGAGEAISVPVTSAWKSLGPAPQASFSGRPATIAISGNFDGHGTPAMFLGIAGGGVWRSVTFTSDAPTWTPLTDTLPPAPSQNGLDNIGALAVDPFNGQVLYAGSGDGFSTYGSGIMKSRDGGNTWTYLGPLANSPAPGISKIFVDPTGPQEACGVGPCAGLRLFAVGDFGPFVQGIGLYMSTNGGTSWTNIQGGLPVPIKITDLEYTVSGGALTLYAGVVTLANNSSANGIWASTDLGTTWTNMSFTAITDFAGQTQSRSAFNLVRLAADRTVNASKGVYALIGFQPFQGPEGILNVFKLTGGAWSPTAPGLTCTCATGCTCPAPYAVNISSSSAIGIDPIDGSVYVGGVNDSRQLGLYQSRDGGASWALIEVGANGVAPHTDQHAWAFYGGAVYNGNDGGPYRFDPLLNGVAGPGNWTSLSTPSLSTILATSISCHPIYPNELLMSSQDNGVSRRSSGTWSGDEGAPGEDAHLRFDPFDATFAYGIGMTGGFYQSHDGGRSFTNTVGTFGQIALHPTSPGRVATGSDAVLESTNHGVNFTSLGRPATIPAGNMVTAIAYGSGNVIHAAWGGRLFRTMNDGADAWPEPNPGLSFGNGSIIAIAVDVRENTNRVFLATADGRLWRSGDGGTTWADISYDFPGASLFGPAPQISQIDLRSETATSDPQVFVASAVGAWVGQPTVLNGDFEVGELTGWTPSGALSTSVSSHSGTYSALVGSTGPSGDSSIAQTFTVPVNNATLSFWYLVQCPDSVYFDWATATLKDNTTNTVTTLIPHTCTNNGYWVHESYALGAIAGHSVTLTLANHDDNYAGDPTFTLYDDVALLAPTTTWHWTRMGTSLPDTNVTDIQFNPTTRIAYVSEYGRGIFANYLGFMSDAAPGSLAAGNTTFVLEKAPDGKVVANQAAFGSAYSGWNELQGGGFVTKAVAGTFLSPNNLLYAFGIGANSQVWANSAVFGSPWSGWSGLGGMTTDAAPAAATSTARDQVFVFIRGLNTHIFQNHATYGQGWVGWTEVPGGGLTNSAVAAATLPQRDVMFLFARGLDNDMYANQGGPGTFGTWQRIPGGQLTDQAPTAAADNNNIFVFVRDMTTGHIRMTKAVYGQSWQPWSDVAGGLQTEAAPSAAILSNGMIFLYAKDLNGRVVVNQGTGGNFGSWFEVGGGI